MPPACRLNWALRGTAFSWVHSAAARWRRKRNSERRSKPSNVSATMGKPSASRIVNSNVLPKRLGEVAS